MAETISAHAANTTRSDIWFEDGNVVIQAEGTLFKVHRGVLVANSSVFEDMFSMPQPPPSEGEVTVEGCPVVHVSDSAADVAIVLRALFLRGYVTTGLKPLSLEIVMAFFRLGQKYDIKIIRAEALSRLHYEYPLTLEDNDKNLTQPMIPYSFWADIDIANLAREQNLLSLLPVALYALCCEIDATQLISGTRRDDSTTTTLSASDIYVCFAAWTTTLPKLQLETTLTWIDPASESWGLTCKKDWCNDIRKKAMRTIFVPCVLFVGLCTWGEFREDYMDPEDNMCPMCVSVAEQAHKNGRIKFWEGLPGAFGLPGWDELGNERSLPSNVQPEAALDPSKLYLCGTSKGHHTRRAN